MRWVGRARTPRKAATEYHRLSMGLGVEVFMSCREAPMGNLEPCVCGTPMKVDVDGRVERLMV